MLHKPSQNQSINLMQWKYLHSTCPNSPQSTLGTLNLQFNLIILNYTSSYRQTAPDIPVELTTGFRLLGQPVGSATFA